MMGAPSLPTAQGAMPAGFAAFLANIGQGPDSSSEGGFDQLLAAAPITNAAATIKIDPAPAVGAATTPVETPVETGATAETQVVKAEPAQTDAATLAANLLVALNGSVPGTPAAPGKPVPAEPETATASDVEDVGEAVAATPETNWVAIVAATVPAAAKPARPADAAAVQPDNSAPALAITARPRDAAMPILVGTEAPALKTADAAPSMTILFTQPAAQGAATLADVAAPAQIAERVLDMDSDGAWIDQLARDIAATKSDGGDINFRLMPRHLGRLDVAMQMGDEGMSLKMDTHHEATATIVTAAQGRLVDELRQQGVRVTGAEVTCTPGETGRQSQSQGQGRTAAPDPSHLIETATERAEPRDEDRAADRRGRFA